MAKKIFQDVIKTRDNPVLLNNKRDDFFKRRDPLPINQKSIPDYKMDEEQNEHNSSKYGLWSVAILSIVFLFFAVSFLFTGAKITIIPKTQSLVLNQNLDAVKGENDNALHFDLVTLSGEETENIQGGEIKDVAIKANGIVLVYNAYSTAPQTFSAGTRLEGTNNKIYKLDKKIVVPGMAKDGTPGSIEASISGAEVGAEWNSVPLDFKIFAFKGTDKYLKIYARSKNEITGGLVGKFADVTSEEKEKAIINLRINLESKLLKKASNQIPSGYILYKDAVFLKDDGGSVGATLADNMVPITVKGTLYGFLFEEKKLSEKIIEKNTSNTSGQDMYVLNIRNLTFSLLNKESVSFKDAENINFTLGGPIKIVWKVNEEKIIEDLLGKSKKDFNQVMTTYSNISSADMTLSPIWSMSFPEKSKDIKVIVNYPE